MIKNIKTHNRIMILLWSLSRHTTEPRFCYVFWSNTKNSWFRCYIQCWKKEWTTVKELARRHCLYHPGYAFIIRNSLVSRKVTLQPTVALSTTEVKYMALAKVAKECILLKGLINNLGFPQDKAIIFCDGLGEICLAKDQVHNERIAIQKVDTKENPTYMLTKFAPQSKFMHYLDLINVDC